MPERLRTFIYSFDRSFEMAIAATSAPLVGLLAERLGFDVRTTPPWVYAEWVYVEDMLSVEGWAPSVRQRNCLWLWFDICAGLAACERHHVAVQHSTWAGCRGFLCAKGKCQNKNQR